MSKKMKKRNAKIRQTANSISLAGSVILMTCVLISAFQYLVVEASAKQASVITTAGFIIFIFMRCAAWVVGGFAQKTIPKKDPQAVPNTTELTQETDPTKGSRFLHTNDKSAQPKNPFMPA